MIKSKHRLKQLFEDTQRLPSSKFYELIDALWSRGGGTSSKSKAGIISLNAGWNWVSIPLQPNLNYNPVCNTYDAADNVVGNKVAYSTLELSRFAVWVNKACMLRWEIFSHT